MPSLLERYEELLAAWRKKGAMSREELSALLMDYRVYFAYNSSRIENSDITYHDTRQIFEDGRALGFTGEVRTLFEIQNQRECHELLLDAYQAHRPLDTDLVLQVHRTLTQGTYDEHRWSIGERPGTFKAHDYVVGLKEMGASAEAVPEEVEQLLSELAMATPDNILTVAIYFHLVFEAIHPFADGNGRVGRALMNYLLICNAHPPIIVYDEDKLAYYGAIQVWDEEGDLQPARDFFRAEAVKTWARGIRAEQPVSIRSASPHPPSWHSRSGGRCSPESSMAGSCRPL